MNSPIPSTEIVETPKKRRVLTPEQREAHRVRSKKYRQANLEKIREKNRVATALYRAANSEKVLAQRRAAYAADPEKYVAYARRWREANPEKHRAVARKCYAKNRTKYLEADKAYNKAHPEKRAAIVRASDRRDIRRRIWRDARSKARKYGLFFDLRLEDIIVPEFCPISGRRIGVTDGQAGAHSPSLRRRMRNSGYTKDNIMIVSLGANWDDQDGGAY